jgi:hypothetical protein
MADWNSAISQAADDPWPTVAAFAAPVYCRNLSIECRVGYLTFTGFALPPLAVSGSRYLQLSTHSSHAIPVAIAFDPDVFHRDSFAKYAAAFFTISKSS